MSWVLHSAGGTWGAGWFWGGWGLCGAGGPAVVGGPWAALEHPVVREGCGVCWGAVTPGGFGGPQLICSSSQVEVGMAL